MNQIDNIIDKLKNNPLFYLFVSSKELFHSNFWFWMGEKTEMGRDITANIFSTQKLVYPEFDREVRKSIKGEKRLIIDLIISEDQIPKIVIENKVKDFPTKEQLDSIKQSFKGYEDVEFVLVTLYPMRDMTISGWEVLSYEDIASRIDSTKFSTNDFDVTLIEQYKKFITLLTELAHNLPCISKYDFAIAFSGGLFDKLNEIKFWEGYQKMRSSDLLIKFNKKNPDINTSYTINNQKATISFTYKIKKYEFGIQIENDQFRRFISGKNAKKIAAKLMSKSLFFDEQLNLERRSKDFLKYGKNWAYQYLKLKEIIPYDALFEMIKAEIDFLKSNHKNIEILI